MNSVCQGKDNAESKSGQKHESKCEKRPYQQGPQGGVLCIVKQKIGFGGQFRQEIENGNHGDAEHANGQFNGQKLESATGVS